MHDKKLTDKEIIKALECCTLCECKDCPHDEETACKENLNQEVLDLITRQQAENENLKVENQALRSAANSLKMHYEEAQAEIERLKGHQKDGFFNLLGNCLVFSKTLKDYNDMRKGLKSEAVKDFAARLKEEYAQGINWFGVKEHYFVNVEDIDNLVKEMVGENNA